MRVCWRKKSNIKQYDLFQIASTTDGHNKMESNDSRLLESKRRVSYERFCLSIAAGQIETERKIAHLVNCSRADRDEERNSSSCQLQQGRQR